MYHAASTEVPKMLHCFLQVHPCFHDITHIYSCHRLRAMLGENVVYLLG